ncbi:MAG: hypothetical protein MZV70_00985 [Desulfobacterales bacterium]|nr:hypothetical protein [Desulfobacterales bacterium]
MSSWTSRGFRVHQGRRQEGDEVLHEQKTCADLQVLLQPQLDRPACTRNADPFLTELAAEGTRLHGRGKRDPHRETVRDTQAVIIPAYKSASGQGTDRDLT